MRFLYKLFYKPPLPIDVERFDMHLTARGEQYSSNDWKEHFSEWFVKSHPSQFFVWYARDSGNKAIYLVDRKRLLRHGSLVPLELDAKIEVGGSDGCSFSGAAVAEFEAASDHSLLFASSNSGWVQSYYRTVGLESAGDWQDLDKLPRDRDQLQILVTCLSVCKDRTLCNVMSFNRDWDQLIQYSWI